VIGYTADTDGALLWNSNIDIKNCSFVGNTDGTNDPHAIEHPAAIDVTYDGLTFSGNDYDIHLTAGATTESSYLETNQDTDVDLDGSPTAVAQTFTTGGTGGELSRARAYLKKTGSPTGNVVAKLYATSGGAPTGSALATSENLATGDIGTSYAWEEFEFKDNYTLAATTTYAISIEYTGGVSDYVTVGVDNSTPSHAGTGYSYAGSWSSQTWDMVHEVNRDGVLQVSAVNGADPGTDSYEITATDLGTVDVENSVTVTLTVKNKETNAVLANVSVAVYQTSDDAELLNEDTNASGIASTTFNYPGSDVDIYWRVRESPAAGDRYFAESGVGKIGNNGYSTTVLMRPLTIS
jgi:hypothetical protein